MPGRAVSPPGGNAPSPRLCTQSIDSCSLSQDSAWLLWTTGGGTDRPIASRSPDSKTQPLHECQGLWSVIADPRMLGNAQELGDRC